MIHIGSYEITNFHVGSSVPNAVYVKDTEVWPGFTYTLTFSSKSYSSGSNLLSSGSNYCRFSCVLRKYTKNGALISTTNVYATPSASYCVADGDKLKFNFDSYKATAVTAGDQTVTLSYSGATTTTTVALQGNVKNTWTEISEIVIDDSTYEAVDDEGTIAASGANDIIFTGGDATTYERWTSGYQAAVAHPNVSYNQAQHSQNNNFTAYAYEANNFKHIYIPNLHTTAVQAGSYTITASYSVYSRSITLNQEANVVESTSHSYAFYDTNNNLLANSNGNIYVTSPSQSITLCVKDSISRTYTSGDTSNSGTTLSNDATLSIYHGASGGCVTSAYAIPSTQNYNISVSENTLTENRISVVVFSGSGYGISVSIVQYAATATDVYALTTSTNNNSLSIGAAAGSISFIVTSTKNGSAYQPTVSLTTNNVGGTISTTGSGPYTVTLTYTANTSTSSTRSATISITQSGTGGQSATISVTQAAASSAGVFDGITIKDEDGDWVVGTVETASNVNAIIIAKNSPITEDAIVNFGSIAFQWMPPTSGATPYSYSYLDLYQTIEAGSTVSISYGGSHTYYGAYLITPDFPSPGFNGRPNGQLNWVSMFSVSDSE